METGRVALSVAEREEALSWHAGRHCCLSAVQAHSRPEPEQCSHPGWLGGPPHLFRLNERMTSSTVAVLPVPGMPLTYRHLPASVGSTDT